MSQCIYILIILSGSLIQTNDIFQWRGWLAGGKAANEADKNGHYEQKSLVIVVFVAVN